MNFIYELLGTPLGWIIWAIYQVISNYGVSLIIFTILLKLCMVPLSIKQQKSTAKMSAFQPLIQEINKKYAKNPQKKNEELQKLYAEEGYSPMSGCLPMLLQFVVLFGILDVVYRPLTHILRLSSDLIVQACQIAGLDPANLYSQLNVVQQVQSDPSKFASLGTDFLNSVQGLDMNFLGLNLGDKPELLSITIIVPILAGLFSFLQGFISMRTNPTYTATSGGGGCTMKAMIYSMPLISIWISFTLPVGVGIYWITSYLFMTIQVIVLNKIYNPKELREQAMKELEEKRKNRKKKVVRKVVRKDQNGKEILTDKELTQKEIDRQRLADARKRDAEKYGEEYVEVTEEDFQ